MSQKYPCFTNEETEVENSQSAYVSYRASKYRVRTATQFSESQLKMHDNPDAYEDKKEGGRGTTQF